MLTTAFVILALTVQARSQVVTKTAEWMYLGSSVSQVNTWNQVFRLNGTVVTGVTCAALGADVRCSVPVNLLPTSNNVLSVEVSDSVVTYSSTLNYNPSSPTQPGTPKQPEAMKLKITITIGGAGTP